MRFLAGKGHNVADAIFLFEDHANAEVSTLDFKVLAADVIHFRGLLFLVF